ncbi:MAG: hypothetical protein MJ162_04955 [Treponema sp.]|nr:hypothetical protein [Treponema sp.]
MRKTILKCLMAFAALFFISCGRSNIIQSINENELYTLPYGNFEEQLSINDLNTVGGVRIGIAMRDGFFYIVDGYARKTMEMNSYGDLLTLFYNEDSEISELLSKTSRPDESVHREIAYPFDYPGMLAVDSNKCIYAVCTIPKNRQEQSEEGLLYSQAVLRFTRDGSSVDYIGQQGPGGTPFPHITNIYTTEKDELVVICRSMDGAIVYWFGKDGFLKYMIPLLEKDAPQAEGVSSVSELYTSIENVIPDTNSYKLFVKLDYYSSYVDEESKVQSGVTYLQSMLYEVDCETGVYENPFSVPPYEESVVVDYSRLNYKIPYDFLGVTKNGWKFFIVKTLDGFNIEMLQNDSQRILRRHFAVNHKENLYYSMSLSLDGVITALYMDKDQARVVWYRTDSLIDSFVKK